jgi:tetratricopeptide (TPR) repeat protein
MVMLLYKGRALAGQGMHEAAIEVFRDALRFRKDRSVLVMSALRMSHARSLATLGRRAAAKKDLARVIADMPDFEPAREELAALG